MMQNSPIRYTWDTREFRVLQYVDIPRIRIWHRTPLVGAYPKIFECVGGKLGPNRRRGTVLEYDFSNDQLACLS